MDSFCHDLQVANSVIHMDDQHPLRDISNTFDNGVDNRQCKSNPCPEYYVMSRMNIFEKVYHIWKILNGNKWKWKSSFMILFIRQMIRAFV